MRILVLLLISTLAFSQSQRKIERKSLFHKAYIRVGSADGYRECDQRYIKLFVGKKKFILESDVVNLDLRIKKRKDVWLAVDKQGVLYDIKAFKLNDELGIMVVPRSLTLKAVAIIRETNICETPIIF